MDIVDMACIMMEVYALTRLTVFMTSYASWYCLNGKLGMFVFCVLKHCMFGFWVAKHC